SCPNCSDFTMFVDLLIGIACRTQKVAQVIASNHAMRQPKDSIGSHLMPRLFFHLTNGEETIPDQEGAEVAPNDVGQISRIIDEMRSNEPDLLDSEGWLVGVVDEDDCIIAYGTMEGDQRLIWGPNNAAFQRKLAELPLASYYAGDRVLTDGS